VRFRDVPRCTSVAITVAFATAAPVGSVMLPSMRPAVDCATAGKLVKLAATTKSTILMANFGLLPADRAERRDVIGTPLDLLVRQPYHCLVNEVKKIRDRVSYPPVFLSLKNLGKPEFSCRHLYRKILLPILAYPSRPLILY
jgi:hypothetical protein